MVAPRFRKTDSIHVPKATAGAILGTLGFSWILILYLFFNPPSPTTSSSAIGLRGLSSSSSSSVQIGLPNGAPPVYGTIEHIEAPSYRLADPKHPRKTEYVYALPSGSSEIKGIALLLHPCYHNGRKFFSKSDTCPTCLGLSEEMRIARIILEQQTLAVVTVTSVERKSGCWIDNDYEHIKDVLLHFKEQHPTATGPVLALGFSAGGKFAAQLAVRNIVDAAMVGVQFLGPELIEKWMAMTEKKPPLYLAVMPKDKERLEKVQAEFQTMDGHGPVMVDTETCAARPLEASYLNNRVPNLTMVQAQAIVNDLIDSGHVDRISGFLIIDPTSDQSNWKDVLKNNCGAKEGSGSCLENQSLALGESSLAKALNRAWAFHEHCSEVTLKALQFFQKELGGQPFLQTL